jgi:hypothetical protein
MDPGAIQEQVEEKVTDTPVEDVKPAVEDETTEEKPAEDKPAEEENAPEPEKDSSVIRQMRRQLRVQQQEIAELKKGAIQKVEPPKRDDFDSDEEFVDARIDFRNQAKAQSVQPRNYLVEKIHEFTKSDPEFAESFETMKDLVLPIVELNSALSTLQYGDEVLKRLVKDPDLTEELSILPPAAFMARVGELHAEIRTEKTKKVQVSKTPTPVKPVAPKGSVEKSYDEMSFEEFEKTRREERRKNRFR